MNRRFFTKGDLFLLFCVSLVLLALFWGLRPKEEGETVSVYVENRLYATFPLSDREETHTVVTEKGSLTLLFTSDGVCASHSDCVDDVCVRTGSISKKGESIVCAPLGVCVTVEGGTLDGVTG